MEHIKQYWSALNPILQQRVVYVGIFLGLSLFLTLLTLWVPEPRKFGSKPKDLHHLLTGADPRSLGIEGLASKLREVTQKNDQLLQRLSVLEEQQKQTLHSDSARLQSLSEAEHSSTRAEIDQMKRMIEQLKEAKPTRSNAEPQDKEDMLFPPERREANTQIPDSVNFDQLFDAKSSKPLYGATRSTANGTALEITLIRAKETSGTGQIQNKDQASPHKSHEEAQNESVFIPAGTILAGHLLNGLDAPTGKGARKEPFPVLARIKQEAILPNRFKADLRECFLIASGYGDLSSERAYLRAETLSCVRTDAKVIEVPIDAYAVGEDGKLGLRGAIVSKQGQLMANALLAGFSKGFSDAFGRTQIPTLMTGGSGSLGHTLPFQSNFSEAAMEGGALKGVGYSMDRLAHYYMDMAESIFPVVEVDATRAIEFVVQRGVDLQLSSTTDVQHSKRSDKRS